MEQIQTQRVLPNPPPSCLPEEQIYKLLRDKGPRKALLIAQSLGMKTAKEVNRDLYDLRRKHLLDLDPNSNTWKVYQPGRSFRLPAPGLGTLLSTWPAPPAEHPRNLHWSC